MSRENKFKDILVKDSNSEIPYKLNIEELEFGRLSKIRNKLNLI